MWFGRVRIIDGRFASSHIIIGWQRLLSSLPYRCCVRGQMSAMFHHGLQASFSKEGPEVAKGVWNVLRLVTG